MFAERSDVRKSTEEAEPLIGVMARERGRLTSFFAQRTASHNDAADLVQALWSRILAIADQRIASDPKAYIWRAATNLLRDRSKIARRRAADRHVSIEDYDVAGPSLERQLEARDMLRLVEAAMLELRPRTREVFMAVRVDGMSYAEVSERIGISRKAIEKEMGRAIAHINRATGRE